MDGFRAGGAGRVAVPGTQKRRPRGDPKGLFGHISVKVAVDALLGVLS